MKNTNTQLTVESFAAFIRERKATKLGEVLARHGVIYREEDTPDPLFGLDGVFSVETLTCSGWGWFREPLSPKVSVNWDEIRGICIDPKNIIGRYRNLGMAGVRLLQEFMGYPVTPLKHPRHKMPICPCCGQRYHPR